MTKCEGIRFNSAWDYSTWLIVALTAACLLWVFFLDNEVVTVIICSVCLLFILVVFKSVYYVVIGDRLIVHTLFSSTAYPIDKIESVTATKIALSAPATSLTKRIAITFSDRKILKSSMPLIISPVRRQQFVDLLSSINHEIKVSI